MWTKIKKALVWLAVGALTMLLLVFVATSVGTVVFAVTGSDLFGKAAYMLTIFVVILGFFELVYSIEILRNFWAKRPSWLGRRRPKPDMA